MRRNVVISRFNKHPLGNSDAGWPQTILWETSLHILVPAGLFQKHLIVGKMPHLSWSESRSTLMWKVHTPTWVNLPKYESSHVTFPFAILQRCSTLWGRMSRALKGRSWNHKNRPSSLVLLLVSLLKPDLIIILKPVLSAAAYNCEVIKI